VLLSTHIPLSILNIHGYIITARAKHNCQLHYRTVFTWVLQNMLMLMLHNGKLHCPCCSTMCLCKLSDNNIDRKIFTIYVKSIIISRMKWSVKKTADTVISLSFWECTTQNILIFQYESNIVQIPKFSTFLFHTWLML
jgi:hypothetical protein